MMEFRSRERFVSLLTCTIGQLCKSGYFDSELFISRVDGLLGITLSSGEVFLVNICEGFVDSRNFERCVTRDCTSDGLAKISACSAKAIQETSITSGRKGHRNLKPTSSQLTLSAKSARLNVPFQMHSETDAVEDTTLNALGSDKSNVDEYGVLQQDNSFAATFVKVEENSDDDLQVLDNFNADIQQDELHCVSQEQKFPACYLPGEQKLLETTSENSEVCGQLCLPNEERSYTTRANCSHQSIVDHPSFSIDFFQAAAEQSLPFDAYCQSLDPSVSSEPVLSPLQAISSSSNENLALRRKRPVPQKQNRRAEKWKYRYDAATLQQCIELVRTYKMSQREAERVFRIPRTTIQVRLARMYPTWVAPPRQVFSRKSALNMIAPNSLTTG